MKLALRAALGALAIVALAGPAGASAATTIDTGLSTDPDPSIRLSCQWGYPNTATYGQTFTVPASDNILDSFSLYVTEFLKPNTSVPAEGTITYRAHLYGFEGGKAIDNSLWTSGPRTLDADATVQELKFDPIGVSLTPGYRYILFVSVSEDYLANTDGDLACLVNAGAAYAGGWFAFLNNGGDPLQWTANTWPTGLNDLGFKASFSSVAPTRVYDFTGFFAPVNNRDANGNLILNQVRAGQAIPVKFSLGGDRGLDVFADGYPRSEAIACDSQAEVDGIEQTVEAGASSLSYAAGSDTYTYVWKTDTAWDDSCRQLVVKFDDGQAARANFKFKP